MSHYDDKAKRTLVVCIFIFFLLVIGIAISGYVSYRNFEEDFQHQAEHQISGITELKANGLANWRKERLGDANFLHKNPAFSVLVERYFENPDDVDARDQLLTWLGNYQIYDQYSSIRLLDVTGAERLFTLDAPTFFDSHLTQDAIACLSSGKITFLDFHRDLDGSGEIHLSILVPIFTGTDNNRPLGVVVLNIDPQTYLYPYIQSWPTDSASAETLLVRREGQDVLFLNELRFKQDAALTLHFPLTDTDLPAVKAVLGETGIVQGTDYRRKPVLADVRAVPDSPWFLASKMDTSEVYAPLRIRLRETFGMIGMAIILAGTGLALIWRQQRVLFYRAQAVAAEALRENEAFTQAIFKDSPIGISVRSHTGQLLSANKAWKKIWAIPESDLQNDFTQDRQMLNFDERDDYLKFHTEDVRRVYEQGGTLYLPELKITRSRTGAAEWISQHFYAIQDAQGQVARVVILTENITERKYADGIIRESEERLAAVIEGSQLGYSDWNIQTGEIRRNERWAGMLGYTLKEIEDTYQQWEDLIHPDDLATAQQSVQDHLDGKTAIHRDEYRLRAKDGSYHWILDRGKIVEYDLQGHPLRMTATHTDITASKLAEEALKESEARYRAVAYSANEAIISVDRMENIIGWNHGAETIFGYSEAESMGRSLVLLMPFRYREDHLAGMARINAGEKPRVIGKTIEVEGLRKDGGEFPMELSLSHWQVANAQFYTAIIRDITERKLAEDQLRQLSSAVEHSPASIVITDIDGNIEYVNPKFTTLTGYSLEEARGQNSRILKSGKTSPETYPELWRSLLLGKEWRGEFLNRKKNGELYWEYASISSIADSKGSITHFIAVKEDITVRKEAEEKIKLLNAELEKLALTDYLTNLYNRRYFMQRGEEEVKRAKRNRLPMALLMLDIDEFKKVNDTYGHEAGDLALQQVSAALKSSLREIDILGRMGGEEFAVLLPNTSLEESALLAERVRQTIATTPFATVVGVLTITICIGVAAFTDEISDIDGLLRNADTALYHAKHNGRDRVIQHKNILNESSGLSSGLGDESSSHPE